MPSPSLVKQLLSIPFAKGLSQREDPRWLAPGALITAQNAVHDKTNILSKRPGSTLLATAGVASTPGQTRSIASGSRLAARNNKLAIVAKDEWTDGVWSYDETLEKPVFKDRVPEVYGFPPRVLAGDSGVVLDMDSCICNGWLVHVWLVGIATITGAPAPGTDVYYQVENPTTGQILVGARSVGQTPAGHGAVAPKVVACGTTAILTFACDDLHIYATALDCTSPQANSWVAASVVTAIPAPPFSLTGGASGTGSFIGVYDVDSVIGDTNVFVIGCGTGTSSATTHITLFRCSAPATLTGGTVVVNIANIDGADAVWTADGSTHQTITAFAIRADNLNDEVLVSYGWNTNKASAGGNGRVSCALFKYTAWGTVLATAVNLVATAGVSPNPAAGDPSPQWIAVARTNTSGFIQYKTYFSPNSSFFGSGQYAYLASYLTVVISGAMVVQPQQPRTTYGVRLASRVIERNGIGYLLGYLPSETQGTYYLFADDAWTDVETTVAFPLRLVGTFAPRLASGPTIFFARNALFSTVMPLSAYTLPHLVSNPLADGGDVVYALMSATQGQITVTQPNLFSWDFASPLNHQAAQLGQNLGLACAAPSAYDGETVFEFGFPHYPTPVSVLQQQAGSGSGLTPGATYGYIFTFEKRDASGQKHRSARSIAFSVATLAGLTPPPSPTTQLTFTVSTCGFTAREKCLRPFGSDASPQGYAAPTNPVIVRAYRTVANGSTYFSLDKTDYVSGGGNDTGSQGATAAIYNDAGKPTVTIVDNMADSIIQSNELLYDDGSDGTQPGSILDNLCPPAFQCLIVHQNRYYGIDGNNVWASKVFTTNEGSGFNEATAFSVDDGPGPVTALASMDANLILFKRDRVFYMTGLGPNDSGGANDWTPPQRIASDVGCIDWRSVVVTPQGCLFMSDNGLNLLTRDLQMQSVTNVEDLLASAPEVSSAVIHPTRNRVIWSANTDDVSSPRDGLGIEHDYILDTWTSSYSVDGVGALQGAVSAVVAQGADSGRGTPVYHWMRANGTVCREISTSSLDGTVYVPTTIETAWIKSEGLEGFARFRRLMVTWQNNDPHQLAVSVAYDYSDTYYLMGIVTATQMLAMTTPLCQELFALPRQRAEAVRFKIVDAPDGVVAPITGAGPTLISLGLEYSAYTNRRLARLPSAQRA